MPGCSLAGLPLLLAQNAAAGGAASEYAGALRLGLIAVAVVAWFYFLLVLPQRKQDKARRDMLAAVKKNDRVLTAAGMYGTVVSADNDADKVVVRIDDERGVKVTFTRASIASIIAADGKDRAALKPQLKDQSV